MVLPSRIHRIALDDAARMTRRFRDRGADTEKGGAFHSDQVIELLTQPDCASLRYYHGLDEAGRQALILVAADPDGADITRGPVLDLHIPCPPFCGPTSPLNSSISQAAARLTRGLRVTTVVLPERDHRIAIAEAARMTRRHREADPQVEKGGAFHAEQVLELLTQPGCVALRYYRGLDDAELPALILVGVDVEGADMTVGPVLDLHIPCPPFCGPTSPLNSNAGALAATDARWAVPALAGVR